MGQILDEQILSPLASLKECGGRASKAFDAVEVAKLNDDLRTASLPVRAAGPDVVLVTKAAERAKIREVDILHLVLGGHLEAVVRMSGEDGVGSLRVDPAEVRGMTSLLMTDLSPAEAFGALRIPVLVGWALIDGAGDGIELLHRRIPGTAGRHSFVRSRREDVNAFAERFTTVVRIATAIDRSPGEVATLLRAERIPCRARRRHLGIDLILRTDLPPSLAA